MESLISFILNFFSKGWKEAWNQYKDSKFSMNAASLDEMVFEDRNKEYGAYILRKNHNWYLATAIAFVSSVFLYVCFLPVYLGWMKEVKLNTTRTWCCCMTPLEPPPPLEVFLPPKTNHLQSGKPRKPRETSKVIYQIPIPAPAEGKRNDRINSITYLAEKINLDVDPDTIKKKIKPPVWQGLPNLERSTGEETGCWCGEIEGLDKQSHLIEFPEHDEFIFVEEEPTPINLNEIVKLLKYPQLAHEAGIYGTTVFRILVDNRGNYVKHITIQKIHPLLTNMIEPHLSKLRFTPAVQGGKPIPFWVNIPFRMEPMR